MRNGRQVVVVQPDGKGTDLKRKRYFVESKKGAEWTPKIRQYLVVKNAYESMMNLWRLNFNGSPDLSSYSPEINRAAKLGRAFWENAKSEANPMARKSELVYKGQHFRSKNELLACQLIDKMGYEFKTEVAIEEQVQEIRTGRMIDVTFYPDAVFFVPEINKVIVLEIDGAMDQDGYLMKAENRKRNYIDSGYVEGIDVVFYRIADGKGLNLDGLEAVLNATIEANIISAFKA